MSGGEEERWGGEEDRDEEEGRGEEEGRQLATGKSAKRHSRKRKITAALAEGTHHFGESHDPDIADRATKRRQRGSAALAERGRTEHLATPWPVAHHVYGQGWWDLQNYWREKVEYVTMYVCMCKDSCVRLYIESLSVCLYIDCDEEELVRLR